MYIEHLTACGGIVTVDEKRTASSRNSGGYGDWCRCGMGSRTSSYTRRDILSSSAQGSAAPGSVHLPAGPRLSGTREWIAFSPDTACVRIALETEYWSQPTWTVPLPPIVAELPITDDTVTAPFPVPSMGAVGA